MKACIALLHYGKVRLFVLAVPLYCGFFIAGCFTGNLWSSLVLGNMMMTFQYSGAVPGIEWVYIMSDKNDYDVFSTTV